MHADYLSYDLTQLTDAASLVVEGTVLSTADTVLLPLPITGDTPQENPYLGMDEEAEKEAITNGGVPGTSVEFRVDAVHRGSVKGGDTIHFAQTGGTVGSVTYVDTFAPIVEEGGRYLLFLTGDTRKAIIGGSAGMYRWDGTASFEAVNKESAPVPELSSKEVADLVAK